MNWAPTLPQTLHGKWECRQRRALQNQIEKLALGSLRASQCREPIEAAIAHSLGRPSSLRCRVRRGPSPAAARSWISPFGILFGSPAPCCRLPQGKHTRLHADAVSPLIFFDHPDLLVFRTANEYVSLSLCVSFNLHLGLCMLACSSL